MHFVPKCGFKMGAQLTFDLSRRICEVRLSQTCWLAVDRESGDADLSREILSGSLCGRLSETHINEAFCLSPRDIFADRCFMILTSKPYMPPSARRLHPAGDGPSDLVRRIFLDKMESRDRHLGLCREAAGQVENRAIGEDPTRLRPQEQLG